VTPSSGRTQDQPAPHVELLFAARLMRRFAVARDQGAIWMVWREVCLAAELWQDIRARGDPGNDIAWRWLATVATAADHRGEVRLITQILACARFWDQYGAWCGQAGDADVLLMPVPGAEIMPRLAATAFPFLRNVDPKGIVALSPVAPLTAGDRGDHLVAPLTAGILTDFAASKILEFVGRHWAVTKELVAMVEDYRDGYGGPVTWNR
jgi:hypothetical protein